MAFAAVVIGVPNQPVVVIAFDQHHAGAGAHIASHGGQSHGVGFRHFGLQGFMQPLLELVHRVVLGVFFQQLGALVALAHISQRNFGHQPHPLMRRGLSYSLSAPVMSESPW